MNVEDLVIALGDMESEKNPFVRNLTLRRPFVTPFGRREGILHLVSVPVRLLAPKDRQRFKALKPANPLQGVEHMHLFELELGRI